MDFLREFWEHRSAPLLFLLLLILLFFVFVVGNHFLKRIGRGVSPFWQIVLIWLTSYSVLKFLLVPPIPANLMYNYMGVITLVIFLFISSSEASWNSLKDSVLVIIRADTFRDKMTRAVIFTAIPLLTLINIYQAMLPEIYEPIEYKQYSHLTPESITVHGQIFSRSSRNPFRVDDSGTYSESIQDIYSKTDSTTADPWNPNAPVFLRYVREGGEIYFQNCHFCHGSDLRGSGMFRYAMRWDAGLNLPDMERIYQINEMYIFRRVAKGGPGLERENAPWNSAMPAMEEHLSTEEIWKVVLFEFWETEFSPRERY